MTDDQVDRPRELSVGGREIPPALVGFLRGLVHAAALGILNFLIASLGGLDNGDAGAVGTVSTIAVAVLRSVEGLLDGKLLGAAPSPRLLGGQKR